MVNKLKAMKDVVWTGDGCFDSMGHSKAKYGAYTILCITIMKIVHFEIVQVLSIIRLNKHVCTCNNFNYPTKQHTNSVQFFQLKGGANTNIGGQQFIMRPQKTCIL